MERNDDQPCPHCHGGRRKERTPAERTALVKRLSRIEGQVRGLRRMVEADAYCPDVLAQTGAACEALRSFGRRLLDEHLRTCVVRDLAAGRPGTIEELLRVLHKFQD